MGEAHLVSGLGLTRATWATRVTRRALPALSAALLLTAPARADAEPLDPFDPTPRDIRVELEISTDPGVLGQSYGAPVAASYSASGGVGTVVIPIESHELMRAGSLQPIPGTFTPIVIEIDLGDLSAASQGASGGVDGGDHLAGFSQNPLGSETLAGYVSGESTLDPGFCTSQQEIDDLCATDPTWCGLTCVIVPGAGYAPATGKVNLVGSESVNVCYGPSCFGPYLLFSRSGDLRLSEAPAPVVVSAAGAALRVALGACLLLAGGVALTTSRRRTAAR